MTVSYKSIKSITGVAGEGSPVGGKFAAATAKQEFIFDFDRPDSDSAILFPVGSVVVGIDLTFAGTVAQPSAIEVGGVAIEAATEAAPVAIPADNSGEVVFTGVTAATDGKIIVRYNKVA